MVVNGRPLKRVKRRVTAELSDFLTFPARSAGVGPFRERVREFLSKHATPPPPPSLFQHLMTWQILFRVGDPTMDGAVVCLDVVEEDVASSTSVYCDQCRVVGWSGNPVCTKRYHFIIKADGHSIGGYHKSCAGCSDILHLSESRCKSCNHVMTAKDVEDWIYHQLDNTTHLLHSVVHSNGFGHLLRVNGREGGSRVLSGCHIMDFWDRLCTLLGVRKVSVMDVSKKFGLDYRLLYSVTKGHPWYGDWGYEFGAGSFALTLDAYKAAMDTLSKQPLPNFLSQGRKPRTHLQDVISFYQSLSECELVNIKDLFCFLMNLIRDARKGGSSNVNDDTCKKHRNSTSSTLCAWTRRDIERVEDTMFRVLRAVSGTNWVSWRALRGAVCKVAASPELLDYCLKEIEGKETVDGMVVHAQCNSNSGAIEYRLEQGDVSANNGMSGISVGVTCHRARYPSEEQLIRDLRYLYEFLLCPETMVKDGNRNEVMCSAARKILDCKQFMKDFALEGSGKSSRRGLENSAISSTKIYLSCQFELREDNEEAAAAINLPPPELLVLSPSATVGDLKLVASKAFEDVYLMFRKLVAEELVDYCGVDDSTQVKLLLGSSSLSTVKVRGRCFRKNGGVVYRRFRMERGVERWTVECSCGAKDDDGERMLACDVCGAWHHTRCAGISDSDVVPAKFICRKCFGVPSVASTHHQPMATASSPLTPQPAAF